MSNTANTFGRAILLNDNEELNMYQMRYGRLAAESIQPAA